MENIKDFLNFINEDTSAVGGPSCGSGDGGGGGETYGNASILGMGSVVNAQPSSFSGTTIGSDWSNGGGTIGSGDVNINTRKKPFLKQRIELKNKKSKNHGSTRNKKLRSLNFDIKQLAPKKSEKILNFDDFKKKNTEIVTKVKDF